MKQNSRASIIRIESTFSPAKRALALWRYISFFALALVVWCALTSPVSAQNVQFTQGSVGSGLDNTIQIPLRVYPGRGATSLPVTLYYSSRVWRVGHLADVQETVDGYSIKRSIAEAIYSEYSASGWTSSLDIPKVEWPKDTDTFWNNGKPYYGSVSTFTYRMARVFIHMPDGSTHELRKSDVPFSTNSGVDKVGTFYAVDGSRMRYDRTSGGTETLYLPDGTQYVLSGDPVKYIDRNGNTLNYNVSTREWTDTLGRVIQIPLPSAPGVGSTTYQLPGVGGTQSSYTLVWKSLSDVLVADSQGNTPSLKVASSHYLPDPSSTPTNQGGSNFPQATTGDSLFHSDYPSEDSTENASTYTYVVGRGQGTGSFNPVVLAEVILPNGLKYQFGYNAYGEIVKVTYPTGGHELCDIGDVPSIGIASMPYSEASRGVTKRLVSADGSGTDYATWKYTSTGTLITTVAPDGTVSDSYRYYVTSGKPGNYWPLGLEDPRIGMPREERIYAPNPNPSGPEDIRGPMLRRTLTNYVTTQASVNLPNNTIYNYQRSARPDKAVSLILDTGGAALAKTLFYDYYTTYESTTGPDLKSTTETYFASVSDSTTAQTGDISQISAGTTASTAETTYLHLENSSYYSRNILGLPTSVVLKDGSGNVVSKSETFYDEAGYAVTASGDTTIHRPSSDVVTWNNPDTSVRGNATTSRHYVTLSPETYLDSHASYDQWGNVRSAFDGSGYESKVDYLSDYNYAYVTEATSADPDGSGPKSALTTTTAYDINTGLVTSTTDANQQETHFYYTNEQNVTDPLNRLRKVARPDNSWTTYDYHDVVGDLYVETKSSFDSSRSTTARQYFDKLGRSVRSFAYEGSDANAPWLVTDTHYDPLMGRVSQVSNPYRTSSPSSALPSSCSVCASSTYDSLGRVTVVTLPDATTVRTEYLGNITTVTDQASKQRRQIVDALGRVVQVDEPDASGSLTQSTYYSYNTQGSLVHIQQGAGTEVQHRYFKYDSLGRLTYEFQVEPKAAPFTTSDADTPANPTSNTTWTRKLVYDETIDGVSYKGLLTSMYDARQVHTSYKSYDNLNRLTQVTYSDGTPAVNNYYDEARTGYINKGRLTTVTTDSIAATTQTPEIPATSQVYDYDLMGRIAHQQEVVGNNTPYTLSYGYNLGGQLTSETYPSGRVVNYSYNDSAGLNSVTSGTKTYANQFDYSSQQGLLKSVTLGNGAVESFDYNNRLQLNSIALSKDNSVLQKYEYKYGKVNADGTVDETKNNGQIGRIEGFIGTSKQWQQRFSYDSLGRLSQASEYRGDNSQLSYQNTFDYDRFGNRYQTHEHNPDTINHLGFIAVNDGDINKANNRFYSSAAFDYDDAGNVTLDNKFTGHRFEYDANNRQRKVSLVDGTGAAWSVYDGGGQRVATISNGTTSIMVYDAGGKLVAEYGTPSSPSGGTQYVLSDHQGSTRVVTNQSGGVISRQDYEPFGKELDAIGMRANDPYYAGASSAKQKYAGMEKDNESGMAHTLWRKYDGMSGRWTSPDPYGGSMSVGNPQSFNRYSYVDNDPVNQTDALGLMAGADQGYGGFEGWGGSAGLDDPHFGGPGDIGEGLMRYAKNVETPLAGIRSGDIKPDGDEDPEIDPGDVVRIPAQPAFTSQQEYRDYFAREFAGAIFGGSSWLGDVAIGFGKGLWNAGAGIANLPGHVINYGLSYTSTSFRFGNVLPTFEASNSTQRNAMTATSVGMVVFTGPVGDLGALEGASVVEGEFSIVDWSGYPEGVPQPSGPFRILEGEEYAAARQEANAANQAIHRANPSLKGIDIHEIHPVKFGGSPTNLANKVALPRSVHAQYTAWWNKLQRSVENR